MSALRVEPLDRRHLGAGDRADRGDAGASSAPLHMHSAGPTHANPATEFGSCKTKLVANHPEQWGVIRTVHRNGATIEVECGHNRMPPVLSFCQCDAVNSRRTADTLFSRSVHGGRAGRVRSREAASLATSGAV